MKFSTVQPELYSTQRVQCTLYNHVQTISTYQNVFVKPDYLNWFHSLNILKNIRHKLRSTFAYIIASGMFKNAL